jgi:hypothetical protein
MTNEERQAGRKGIRHWAGMPTTVSQLAELFIAIFPAIVVIGALLLLLVAATLKHMLAH